MFYFSTILWLRLQNEIKWANINFERRGVTSAQKSQPASDDLHVQLRTYLTFGPFLNQKRWRYLSIVFQHVLLKKFTVFLKFKFLKKLRYSIIFFFSQPQLAYAHWRVDGRVDDEKKIHDGWEPMVEYWRYDGGGT